jgi:hypothetical protein
LDLDREALYFQFTVTDTLGDECRGGGRLVFPCWRENGLDHVVAGETVDTRFDQDKTELAVDVLTVTFQMLAHADGTLDEEVEILWDVWFQSDGLHDAEDFVAVDEADLGDAMGVSEDNT